MQLRRHMAVVAALIVAAVAVHAQSARMTLSECVERAVANHPRVALAASGVAVQKSVLEQVQASARLPRFESSLLLGPVPGAEGNFADPNVRNDFSNMSVFTRVQVDAVQPLFTFGRIEGKRDAAAQAVSAAREAQTEAANEVRRDVARLYYGLLLARETAAVLADVAAHVQAARDRVVKGLRNDSGEFTTSDLYRLELFDLDVKARQQALSATEQNALVALRAAMSYAPSADVDIADTTLSEEMHAVPFDDSGATRPELRQTLAAELAREALLRASRAEYRPQVFLGTGLRFGFAPNRTDYHSPFIRDDFNFLQGSVAIGAQFSFNFASIRAKAMEAQAELNRARAQTKAASAAIGVEISKARTDLSSSAKAVELRRAGLHEARSWLAAEESNFDLGVGRARDLVEAYEAYVRSRIAVLTSLHEHQIAWAEYQYAVGGGPQ